MTKIRVNDLDYLRSSAKRLERYARRAREHLSSENQSDLADALPDLAETAEIRLAASYAQLKDVLTPEG
jgi:hypothetical protein